MSGAGDLRSRIAVQRVSRTTDAAGGGLLSWSTFATVWARVATRAGAQNLDYDRLQTDLRHHVTIRFRDDIAAGDRVLWDGRTLRIEAVVDADGHKRWLVLDCREEAG